MPTTTPQERYDAAKVREAMEAELRWRLSPEGQKINNLMRKEHQDRLIFGRSFVNEEGELIDPGVVYFTPQEQGR